MTKTIDAVYAGGVLRPLEPLTGLHENDRVRLTVESPAPASIQDVVGIMPDDDAAEMMRIINDEFGRIDPEDWK